MTNLPATGSSVTGAATEVAGGNIDSNGAIRILYTSVKPVLEAANGFVKEPGIARFIALVLVIVIILVVAFARSFFRTLFGNCWNKVFQTIAFWWNTKRIQRYRKKSAKLMHLIDEAEGEQKKSYEKEIDELQEKNALAKAKNGDDRALQVYIEMKSAKDELSPKTVEGLVKHLSRLHPESQEFKEVFNLIYERCFRQR